MTAPEPSIEARALQWCKANDGGRLCVWWPAGGGPEKGSYPIMAVGWDHGGTGELGTFYGPQMADAMQLICDVFNWALEQLAPSTQGFYGERTYSSEVTLHRTELIPGGKGALVGFSDDHPGKQFLLVPEQES